MDALSLYGLGLFWIVLQTTLLGHAGWSEGKAPLVLSTVIYAGFYLEEIRGLVLSFFLGYSLDVFSGSEPGISSILMVLLCLLGQQLRKGIVVEGAFAVSLVSFVLGALYGACWAQVYSLFQGDLIPDGVALWEAFRQAVILGLAAPFLFEAARKVHRAVSKGRKFFRKAE
jgi:rod shape-determining protein MreD